MPLTISTQLLHATTSEGLREYRAQAANADEVRHYHINTAMLDQPALQNLVKAAHTLGETATALIAGSLLVVRDGPAAELVEDFDAFPAQLLAFFRQALIDGWIYATGDDGRFYPELVTRISATPGIPGRSSPSAMLHTQAYGYSNEDSYKAKYGPQVLAHAFLPQDVLGHRIGDVLAARGLYHETPALKAAHMASLARHREVVQHAFSQQFRLHGATYCYEENNYRRRGLPLDGRKVIHDLEPADYAAFTHHAESEITAEAGEPHGNAAIPEHPLTRVFDLKTHEFLWVHSDGLTPYRYDQSLRHKLVLPETHRELLDVLTTDIDVLVDDLIEGKSAGNVILCKGRAGVGKTLTAEVYAELTERPLYAIHSGNLGTVPEQINKNLQKIFMQAKRWNCVLLLDEADIFVMQRAANIEQNAIVAEFLRTLEYFDGLLFMTTNRPDDIDDAIISRCAAIIDYPIPGPEASVAIWRVMAAQYQAGLDDALIAELVRSFPGIAPRDIKMLLRLALRVAKKRGMPLSMEIFWQCAMFRAVTAASN
ncbi:AAA family ATPase [Methylobacillus arboreus]|uniref:AAA family ATPase n=1 Tax=Methylobacillus arboreus TaxID=755170 RepID=UPI001E4E4118|nr:AAA family ATPase [Methylobacillus arboreus]MCB5190201.1 AAA family ATPase [Methylobacillus arboreus]